MPSLPPQSQNNQPPFPWWIPLLILVLLALLIWRYLATEPVRRAARHPEQAAEILFGATCAHLALRGIRKKPQETLRDFALRADRENRDTPLPRLVPLSDAYAAQLYGRHTAPAKPFRDAYLSLRAAARPWIRFFLATRRMLSKN